MTEAKVYIVDIEGIRNLPIAALDMAALEDMADFRAMFRKRLPDPRSAFYMDSSEYIAKDKYGELVHYAELEDVANYISRVIPRNPCRRKEMLLAMLQYLLDHGQDWIDEHLVAVYYGY